MFVTVWRFILREGAAESFERHYGRDGTWAALFRTAPGYVGTELYRNTDNPLECVTVDTWQDEASYQAFRSGRAEDYDALDRAMESLTVLEEHLL